MGVNGSLSKSKGKGILVGYATAKSGKRVEIRVPELHAVAKAPNDLLSVSAMVAQNFEFHFTRNSSWVNTPDGERIELEAKAGLFWLKWYEQLIHQRKAPSQEAEVIYSAMLKRRRIRRKIAGGQSRLFAWLRLGIDKVLRDTRMRIVQHSSSRAVKSNSARSSA
jgi:hypothetical protein